MKGGKSADLLSGKDRDASLFGADGAGSLFVDDGFNSLEGTPTTPCPASRATIG